MLSEKTPRLRRDGERVADQQEERRLLVGDQSFPISAKNETCAITRSIQPSSQLRQVKIAR